MSAEDLMHQFDDLRFTAEEQDIVYAPPVSSAVTADDPRLSLVGRVFSTGKVDGATLIRVFRAVWKHEKALSITKLRYNFFLIPLASETVRTDILKRGPWVFNDDWFALLALNLMLSIDEYHFTRMIICVRILRVPIGLMTESLGRSLGARIGMVVGTDTRVIDGNMGEFLRVRISLDVTKPLRRCVALGRCGTKPKLCPLEYEKLPKFCHGCGIVGHLVVDCPTHDYSPTAKYQYGDWLRANIKTKHENIMQSKGRIQFHEEGGSSSSHSSGIPHTEQPAPPLNAFPNAAGTVRSSSPPIAAADPVFVAEPVEAADEGNVNGGTAAVDAGSADVFAVDASGKIHVSDHVKRAPSSTPTSKEMRTTKAGMSSSKNSLAAVDKQPRRGK
ncbi:hypothetical protein GQ457_05G022820 [Hibiscus cannabinus]